MSESPLSPVPPRATTSKLRSNQDVVFIDVGARQIESNVVRDGIPIAVHDIDPDILNDVVIGEPIILYRIVSQSVKPGTPVPLDTVVDLTLARPNTLPVGIVRGVHEGLRTDIHRQRVRPTGPGQAAGPAPGGPGVGRPAEFDRRAGPEGPVPVR